MNPFWNAGLIAIGLALLGCNGPEPANGPATPGAEPIRRREIADLPPVGAYAPPLDGNVLEVAPPEGWNRSPRNPTFLIGWAKGDRTELPRITINAEEPPAGSPERLTEENAADYAARLDQELQKSKKKVEESCLPIVLGKTVFIRHVRQVQVDHSPCVLQSLQTIQNSRLYTVDLIVEIDSPRASDYDASLLAVRDYGYAVAANMRFAPAGEKFDPLADLPKAKPPKTDKPAENEPKNKPAEKKTSKPKPPA